MEAGLLLIPGPVPLHPRVLEELAKPALPHYGDAWVRAFAEPTSLMHYLWSSPDGHVFPLAGPGVDAAFSASQKCLAAPAGIAPVFVAPSVWEATDPSDADGWYLNLFTWERYAREWGDWHPTPTTISSNLFYAFHRALLLVKEEGLEARFARHAKMSKRLRDGLSALGFKALASPEFVSNTVTCMSPPDTIDANTLVKRL